MLELFILRGLIAIFSIVPECDANHGLDLVGIGHLLQELASLLM